MLAQLSKILSTERPPRVLVVGDVILDETGRIDASVGKRLA